MTELTELSYDRADRAETELSLSRSEPGPSCAGRGVPSLVYPSVYTPSMYRARACDTAPARCTTARHGKVSLLASGAVRLGGFRIVLFLVKTRPEASRFNVSGGLTTCVCQAKTIFRLETEKYSGELKRQLPQMGSFSEILADISPSFAGLTLAAVSGRAEETFLVRTLFSPECFSGKL